MPGAEVVAYGAAWAASRCRRCRLVRGREATAGYRGWETLAGRKKLRQALQRTA